jgi:hypothetical protein
VTSAAENRHGQQKNWIHCVPDATCAISPDRALYALAPGLHDTRKINRRAKKSTRRAKFLADFFALV